MGELEEQPIHRIRRYIVLLMAWYPTRDFSASAHWFVRQEFMTKAGMFKIIQGGDLEEWHQAAKRCIKALGYVNRDSAEDLGKA